MKKIILAFATLSLLVACGGTKEKKKKEEAKTQTETKAEEGWTLNGTIEGVQTGTVLLMKDLNTPYPGEYPIVDGKFSVKGEYVSEPKSIGLKIKELDIRFGFYVENGVTNFTAKKVKYEHKMANGEIYTNYGLEVTSLDGSIANKHQEEVYALTRHLQNEYTEWLRSGEKRSSEDINKKQRERAAKEKELKIEYIKKNPSAFYSAEVVNRLAHGENAAEIARLLTFLDPKMDNSIVKSLKERAHASKDVKISDLIKASNVSYQVDKSYNGSAFKDAKYLGILNNGNLVTLNNNKTVTIIDAKGKQVSNFTVSTTSVPSTMAVDSKNNIYVITPEEREVEREFRGKKMKSKAIVGYSADIFSVDGKKMNTIKLEGVKQATGARIADNKLMVADMSGRNIGIFNITTGAREANIDDMRPCCGILDFDVNDKNEVLVANLGAFRVQSYDLKGKQILAFGSRGPGVSEFHGCCNPVSVAYLSNGAIVTVEKDPTRVKVFSNEGAIAIKGIDEMVKGCSYIPMAVDAKDNLYLASPTKGVVRCVSI